MNAEKPTDDFASLFEASAPASRAPRARALALGDACRAEVVQLVSSGAFVELAGDSASGKRQQAFIKREDLLNAAGEVTAKLGDMLEAVVVEIDPRSGDVRLGRTMGKPEGLGELTNAYAARVPVEGKVSGVNKGGLEVDMAGLRAFCPISQADRGFVADPQTLIGKTLEFIITELRDDGRRLVVSRRAALEQAAKLASAHTLAQLQVGATVRGTVTAVREFGAFVDLGGIEGLIPNAELSHDRSQKAADVLTAGDVVDVQVREIKEGVLDKRQRPTTKITLSLKALAQDPWLEVESVAPIGTVLRGTVTRLFDFGAFVRLAPGIEGLLHVSELGGKVSHPSAVLKVGETLNVVVRSIDRDAKKLSLSPSPDGLEVGAAARTIALQVGSIVSGVVDHVETFGVFMQVDGTRGRVGRGLIPNAELGTARGSDTRKLFPPGTPLSAKVLETGDGKLRLSVRAIKDDEERADYDGYRATTASASKMGTLGDLFRKK